MMVHTSVPNAIKPFRISRKANSPVRLHPAIFYKIAEAPLKLEPRVTRTDRLQAFIHDLEESLHVYDENDPRLVKRRQRRQARKRRKYLRRLPTFSGPWYGRFGECPWTVNRDGEMVLLRRAHEDAVPDDWTREELEASRADNQLHRWDDYDQFVFPKGVSVEEHVATPIDSEIASRSTTPRSEQFSLETMEDNGSGGAQIRGKLACFTTHQLLW